MIVSLIITTYNREDALELSLLSAFGQEEKPDEILVADDGSGRGTAILIEKMSKLSPVPVFHVWQEDKGFRAAMIRNKAITRARGEYIIFVDGDMILHKRFVQDHKSFSKEHFFTQGSRVLLSQQKTAQSLEKKQLTFSPFESGLSNRKNAIRSLSLSRLFSGECGNLKGTRTCNFALWKSDAIEVNGFNEDFTGWGREDSEFALRLINNGISRQNLRFKAIACHLSHPHNSTSSLPANDKLLEITLEKKMNWCRNGIDKYLGN